MSIEKLIAFGHLPAPEDRIKAALREWGSRAGLDLGKARHPSHLAVLLELDNKNYQIASVWFDREDYTRQLAELEALFKELYVAACCWDKTRGELSILEEQRKLPVPMQSGGVVFTPEMKNRLAGGLAMALDREELILLPDERQRKSILQVTNTLQAGESETGHGEAFWSLALALEAARRVPVFWAKMIRQVVVPLKG